MHGTMTVTEVTGLQKAIEYVNIKKNVNLTEESIEELHEIMMSEIQGLDWRITPGRYRDYPVFTFESLPNNIHQKHFFTDHTHIEEEMNKLFYEFNYGFTRFTLEDIAEFKVRFINIHPFGDGNGRTSRLLLNWLLVLNDYVPITIEYGSRDMYIESLKGEDNIEKFTKFIVNNLKTTYQLMLD